jgi:hypothetical protein
MAHLICIRWDQGEVDNHRGPNGETVWERTPPRGWSVDAFGDLTELLAQRTDVLRLGPRIFVQPWLLPTPAFPGGEIDVEEGDLVFRPHAV